MTGKNSVVLEELWGTLATDGATGSVRFERRFATDAADLWASVSRPDRLARWFCTVTGELRAGGDYRADLGRDGVVHGRVLFCDPGRGYTVSWEDGGTQESEIDVTVRSEGAGAVLVLHHRALPMRFIAEYGAGWQAFLEHLESGGQTGTGRTEDLLPPYRQAAARTGVPAWAADLDGVLRRRDGLPAVRFDRPFATTPEDLWSAITEPERLARWLMPVDGDLRAGGTYTIDYGDDGVAEGTVVDCDPGRAFTVTWQIAGEPAGLVSARIVTGDHDLVLRLDHVQLPEDQGIGYAAGWHTYLDRLAGELAEHGSADDVDFGDRWAQVVAGYRQLGAIALGRARGGC